ncbi:MAG: hypothetical protein OEV44_15425 [Spirochaetota bacterium]|nr:hypothetical protein [Spirochaetota bacterium]
MNRKIKIKITKDGKVEIDSSIFEDCKDVAEKLKNILGQVEEFSVKEESDMEEDERLKIDIDD